MSGVILECFPGLGVLGMGFEAEGFTVVKGPDVLWGGDVRTWDATPLRGRIDGVIGGDPCQAHSSLANLVRAKGLEPRFGDLSGEYQRIVEEVQPAWFLRENVPQTPWVLPKGYAVRRFELEHSHLGPTEGEGQVQMRRRAFWFGVPGERWDGPVPELRGHIEHCWFVLPGPGVGPRRRETAVDADPRQSGARFHRQQAVSSELGRKLLQTGGKGIEAYREKQQAVAAESRAVPVALGGSGKVKRSRQTAVGGHDGIALQTGAAAAAEARKRDLEANPDQRRGSDGRRLKRISGEEPDRPTRNLADMLELQGLPPDLLEHAPYTVQAKRKLVGNAVPLAMAKALARAVKQATA